MAAGRILKFCRSWTSTKSLKRKWQQPYATSGTRALWPPPRKEARTSHVSLCCSLGTARLPALPMVTRLQSSPKVHRAGTHWAKQETKNPRNYGTCEVFSASPLLGTTLRNYQAETNT